MSATAEGGGGAVVGPPRPASAPRPDIGDGHGYVRTPNRVPDATDLPDSDELRSLMRELLGSNGDVTIVDRETNAHQSTFASEILTLRMPTGQSTKVLCKYLNAHGGRSYGHRGEPGYEATVYENLLHPFGYRPRLHGVVRKSDDEVWLFTEYLDRSLRAGKIGRDGDGVVLAAAWIARFHGSMQPRVRDMGMTFLNRYSRDYFMGWTRRTVEYTATLHTSLTWIPEVCRHLGDVLVSALDRHPTVIHGEFVSSNILVQGSEVFPIDWESAAIGPAEADLAALTERWPDEVAARVCATYAEARWGTEPPADFEHRMLAARAYWTLRWLGQDPRLTLAESSTWRLAELHRYAVALGILPRDVPSGLARSSWAKPPATAGGADGEGLGSDR